MLAEIPFEQVRDVVDGVAQRILAAAGIAGPPVDAFEVARRLGIVLAWDDATDVRARFVRLPAAAGDRQPTILVADDPRPERRHWAVAHEIGECEAHRVFAELGVDPRHAPPGAREAAANQLAGRLLLPRDWFAADGAELAWDLVELKARYATASHELIARRMLEMAPPAIITVFDHDRQKWRRGNCGRTPPLTPPECAARRAAHRLGRPAQCDRRELPDGIDDVRAWPVHEPNWKREIIRAELAEAW
jgi:Zn-dependent peptidase ImmA (M78 family)